MHLSPADLPQEQAAPLPPAAGQFVRFLLVGGSGALAFAGVSAAAVTLFAATPAWLVSALCYAAFIVPVYLLHRRFSFATAAAHRQALPRYAAVQLCGIGLATLFSWLAYGVVGLPTLLAAGTVIALTSALNFIILRRWAFAKI